MKHLHLASTVLLAVSVVSSSAWADEPAATAPSPQAPLIPYTSYSTVRAQEMFFPTAMPYLKKAQALEKEGKTQEALEKYAEAYFVQSLTDVEVEVALAQARAGLYLPAARTIQTVLSSQYANGLTVHSRENLTKYLTAIKRHIGTIEIKINVSGVRVTVDGEYVRDWPYFSEFYVEPGKHTVKAVRSGYWQNQTEVEVQKGEQKELSIAMQERVNSHYVAFPSPPINISIHANLSTGSKEDQPTWPKGLMVASGVGMGLGLGALATGLVLTNNAETKEASNTWTGVSAAGGILLGLSLTGLIIGLASRPDPAPPNVIITPQVSQDGGGVQLSGTMP